MSTRFWAVRFFQFLLIFSVVLVAVHRIKGYSLQQSVWFGLGWGFASAVIYIGARIYHSRRGQACAICEVVSPGSAKHE